MAEEHVPIPHEAIERLAVKLDRFDEQLADDERTLLGALVVTGATALREKAQTGAAGDVTAGELLRAAFEHGVEPSSSSQSNEMALESVTVAHGHLEAP